MANTPTPCSMRLRIIFASIGIFVGVSILLTFGLHYKNWDAATWGLASGVFAAITLSLHVMYVRSSRVLDSVFLVVLIIIGLLGQIISIAATIAYITIAIVQHQGLSSEGKSYYVAAVWSAMTWKWTFLLFLYSRQYKKLVTNLSIQADPII